MTASPKTGYRPCMQRVRELWQADRGRVVHYLVAVFLAVFLVIETATNDLAPGSIKLLAVVGAIAVLFTRDAPFVAPLVVGVVITAMLAIDADAMYDSNAPFLLVLLLPWCLGTYNPLGRAVVGLIAFEALGLYANLQFDDYWAIFWIGSFVAVSWTIGVVLSRRGAQARELAERAKRLEHEHIEAAERAVAEERQRIARELHDVIAHSVSVMTVQAGAVRRLLHPEQEKERQALETVEATGRQALTEMRRLVGLLREQGAMPEFSPQPGMGTIESLLDGVRAAGLPVELEVDGAPQELPPGVDLAAYRVVQEALTNALKYGGTAHAWVAVHWRDGELELEISNDGSSGGDGSGGGHGLAGMRERVSLYGGAIESGPRDGGGYVVRARLPLEEAV